MNNVSNVGKTGILELLGLEDKLVLNKWQRSVFERFLTDFKENKTEAIYKYALCGAHGVGKTMFGALLIIAHLLLCYRCRRTASYKSVVYSGSEKQLKQVLWNEIELLMNMSTYLRGALEFTMQTITLHDMPKFSISARACNPSNIQSLAGVHAENVLIVADEATAISDSAFGKMETFFTGGCGFWLTMGNPTSTMGYFYDLFSTKNNWFTQVITRFDVSDGEDMFANEMLARYGEDSDEYRIRVLGLFPTVERGGLFPLYMLDDAGEIKRENPEIRGPFYFCIDVASDDGANYSAIIIRNSNKLLYIDRQKCTHEALKEQIEDLLALYTNKGSVFICIDSVGIGFGISDYFKVKYSNYQSISIEGLRGGDKPRENMNVINRRAEVYFQLRNWLKEGGYIPQSTLRPVLWNELKTIKTKLTPGGLIALESKDDMEGESPDLADALAYTFGFGNTFIDRPQTMAWGLAPRSRTKYNPMNYKRGNTFSRSR